MKKILIIGCMLSMLLSGCAEISIVESEPTARGVQMENGTGGAAVISIDSLLGNSQNYSNYLVQKTVSEKEDGMYFVTFQIQDENQKEIQTIEYDTYFDKKWYDEYQKNGGEIFGFVDLNLDGYPDFIGQIHGAIVNQYYNIYLYDIATKQFVYNSDFSGLCLPTLQAEKKLILSVSSDRGIPSFTLYYIGEDKLEYLGAIVAEISENGKITYMEKLNCTLLPDGTITYLPEEQVKQIKSINDIDPVWNSTGFKIRLE